MALHGPHRSADYVARCFLCAERAVETCARCRLPWCDAHGSLDPDLCRECDAAWQARRQAIEATAEVPAVFEYAVAALAPAAVLALVVYAGVGFYFAVVVTVGAMMLGVPIGGAVATLLNKPLRLRAQRRLRRSRIDHLLGRDPPQN